MTVDLKKLNSHKGDFTRAALVKLPQAKLYKLAYELELEGDLPEDKNALVSLLLKRYNEIKITTEDNSEVKLPTLTELKETAGKRVIEGPLSPEDEALVNAEGTQTGATTEQESGEGTEEGVNLGEEEDVTDEEVADMDDMLERSGVIKELRDRIAALETGGGAKASGTLHGHIDDLRVKQS